MKLKIKDKRIITFILLLFLVISNFSFSFAYWASSISGNSDQADAGFIIGDWYDGIPIYTVDEFIEMITTDSNSNHYVLANDLDFENITPITWTQTKNIRFMGTFDGLNRTISNINLVDYPGIFGILEGATIKNLHMDLVNISYTTSDSIPSGILASRVISLNNVLENITISNSVINNSNVYSGGLIGQFTQTSGVGTATISNITLSNTTVSGGVNSTLFGNGGLIGTANNFNLVIENINLEVDVLSSGNISAGGLLGSAIGNTSLQIDDVQINASDIQIVGTGNTIGAGGFIGLLQNTSHYISNSSINNSKVESASLSGGIIGYANSSSGTLNLSNVDVINSTVNSSNLGSTRGVGGIIALVNGFEVTLRDIYVSSDITSTNRTNAGGIIGFSTASSTLDIDGITINESIITIIGIDNALGAAGVIGLLHGSGHVMSNITVIDSEINSGSLSGGVIGYANQASGSLSLSKINVIDTLITSSNIGTTRGTGGMISVVNGYEVTMTELFVSATIISTDSSHAGGIISYVSSTGTILMDTVDIFDSTVTIEGTGTSLGAGGVIGRLQGSNHDFKNINVNQISILSASLSGGIIGIASQTSGIMDVSNITIDNSSVISSTIGNTRGSGGVIGSIAGYIFNLSNASISVNLHSTDASSAGGITAHANSSSQLNLNDVIVYESNIQVDGSNVSIGAGGLVGVLYGTGHLFSNIYIYDTQITSQSSSGGIVGFMSQTSGTLMISNLEVINSNILSSLSNSTYGVGGVAGTVSGYTLTIDSGLIEAIIIGTGNTNAGGIIGSNRSNTILIFDDIQVNQSNIRVEGVGTSLGSGGVIGRLYGSNHEFSNIRVVDTLIESNSSSGGLIGYANQSGGSAAFNNIKVNRSNILTTAVSSALGSGGLIGFNQSYTYVINDVYINGLVQAENANVGGIIGYSRYLNMTLSRSVIYANLIISNPASTDRGVGGVIGRNRNGQTVNIIDLFFTGYLKAHAPSDEPYTGVLRAIDTNVTITNVRSAQITYFTSGNPDVTVDTDVLYDRMRGQNPDFISTYTLLRTSLDELYWTTNFINISSSSLWTYNPTTNLYEIIN